MDRYPVKLTKEKGRVLAVFPDIAGVHTFGEDEPEALARALDALETMLTGMIEDREEIPAPRVPRRGESFVVLPALTAAKVELYRAMRKAGVGKAALARRLNCHLPQIDRLLDLRHGSKLDQIEQALAALGKRIEITVTNAA